MAFSDDLKKWAVKTKEKCENIGPKIALELFSRIVQYTPVDTGRARANWQIGGSLNSTSLNVYDPMGKGSGTVKYGASILSAMPDTKIIWIFNNLVYIVPLEYGHSDQAPNGMVRRAIAEFQALIAKAAAK
jgi:hypothetical protein